MRISDSYITLRRDFHLATYISIHEYNIPSLSKVMPRQKRGIQASSLHVKVGQQYSRYDHSYQWRKGKYDPRAIASEFIRMYHNCHEYKNIEHPCCQPEYA